MGIERNQMGRDREVKINWSSTTVNLISDKMALAAALASWNEPCTSAFAAWRAEIYTVMFRLLILVQLMKTG